MHPEKSTLIPEEIIYLGHVVSKEGVRVNPEKIAALEKEIAEIDHQLLMNYDETIAETGFFDRYQERKKSLETLMEQWEELTLSLENL